MNTKMNRKTVVVLLLLILSLTIIAQASAARISCRADPIVMLSDGTKLQFATTIETTMSDVIAIRYELHVPVGVTINRVIYIPKWAANFESIVLVADQAANHYQIKTVVQTGTANVAVKVNSMAWVPLRNGGQGLLTRTASGVTGQVITITY